MGCKNWFPECKDVRVEVHTLPDATCRRMEQSLKDDQKFDASQYAFFGEPVSQEFELGGLDEEDDVALGGDFEEEEEKEHLVGLDDRDEVKAANNVLQADDVPPDISEITRFYQNIGLNVLESDLDAQSWYGNYQRKCSALVMAGSYPHVCSQTRAPIQSGKHLLVSHGQEPQNSIPHGPAFPLSAPLGISVPQFLPYEGSHGVCPPPQVQWMGPNMQPGESGRLLHGLVHEQMIQQPALPREELMHRHLGHSRITPVDLQQAIINPSVPADLQKPRDYYLCNPTTGRDFRDELQQRSRLLMGRPHQQRPFGPADVPNRSNFRQQFRSKYMSPEEIESVSRIQLASTHTSDSYIDDYYHQAVQAKLASGQRRHFHFAPSHLRDLPSHRRAPAMHPTFLPVNGLGEVPFSSIRRPRPLVEVENFSRQAGLENLGLEASERPLEQEPMLAARIAIEDGLCLLLDVDDIDRFLIATPLPDGGAQLMRQRQLMLQGLAASLQLIDPLATRGSGDLSKHCHLWGTDTKEDFVFLHLVSLSKGRKLVYRYLQLLPLESELIQVVCMAVFRHLRFLFGAAQNEPGAAAATAELANTVADCASRMDLNSVSDCLASVVVSSEQPPLRPFGSTAGDGASMILRSALDRASDLLTDRGFTFPLQDRAVWQATFDRFFLLLYGYCTNKFDTILRSVAMSSPPGMSMAIPAAAAGAMSKEMPIEVLRASLPHMNEYQRKSLLDFTQRSIALGASGSRSNNSKAVRG